MRVALLKIEFFQFLSVCLLSFHDRHDAPRKRRVNLAVKPEGVWIWNGSNADGSNVRCLGGRLVCSLLLNHDALLLWQRPSHLSARGGHANLDLSRHYGELHQSVSSHS